MNEFMNMYCPFISQLNSNDIFFKTYLVEQLTDLTQSGYMTISCTHLHYVYDYTGAHPKISFNFDLNQKAYIQQNTLSLRTMI